MRRVGDSVTFTNEAGRQIKADLVVPSADSTPLGPLNLRVPGEVNDRIQVPYGLGTVGPLWQPLVSG